jgi:hypothetical protein
MKQFNGKLNIIDMNKNKIYIYALLHQLIQTHIQLFIVIQHKPKEIISRFEQHEI